MQIKIFMSEDEQSLTATAILEERKFHRDPISVLTKKEVIDFVQKQHPGFEVTSGPLKISNRNNRALKNMWEFKLVKPRSTNQKKAANSKKSFSERVSRVSSSNKTTRRRTKKKLDSNE